MSDYFGKKLRNNEEDKAFVKQIERLTSGKMKPHEVIRIGTTPFSLRIVGAPVMPLMVKQNVIKNSLAKTKEELSKNIRKKHTSPHTVDEEVIKQLSKSLRTPLFVCMGNHEDSLVVVTDLKNNEGYNLYASVDLDRQGGKSRVSYVSTISPKDNPENWMQTFFDNNQVLAINKNEAIQMYTDNWIPPPESLTIACFDDSIAYTDNNVKTLEEMLHEISQNVNNMATEKTADGLNNGHSPVGNEKKQEEKGEDKPMDFQNMSRDELLALVQGMQGEIKGMQGEINTLKETVKEQGERLAVTEETVKEQGERIANLEDTVEVMKSFSTAVRASISFEQTMAEVERVTNMLTDSDTAKFYCFDSTENKFFSTEDALSRTWHESTDILADTMKSKSISLSEDRTTAHIPVISNDDHVIGVIAAEKQQGFTDEELKHFGSSGDVMGIIDLAIKKEEIHLNAITDNLTHLKNRDGLAEYQKNTLVPNSQTNTEINLLMCDIDKFKRVNDTFGHKEGDRILKEVAAIVKEHTRTGSDCAFRWGGEEMVCILNCPPDKAVAAAERLRKTIEDNVHTLDGKPVTMSIGIHKFGHEMSLTVENVTKIYESELEKADAAVYAAKETGRNRVVSADPDIMKAYIMSRAADVISKDSGESRENTLETLTDKSMLDINKELIMINNPESERLQGQISEFIYAQKYVAEKAEKEKEKEKAPEKVEQFSEYDINHDKVIDSVEAEKINGSEQEQSGGYVEPSKAAVEADTQKCIENINKFADICENIKDECEQIQIEENNRGER